MTRLTALVSVLTMLALAGCGTAPVVEEATATPTASCPPIPIQECVACEARACPAAVMVERIVEKPVPAPVSGPATAGELGLPVIGAVEWATVEPPALRLEALIDTGAETTTMNASNIRQLEKDGTRFILFDVVEPESGEVVEVEAALQRKVVIKRGDASALKRYVVRLWVSVGENRSLIDVSLTERTDAEYPLTIGRNFLTDVAIVDVSRRHLLD